MLAPDPSLEGLFDDSDHEGADQPLVRRRLEADGFEDVVQAPRPEPEATDADAAAATDHGGGVGVWSRDADEDSLFTSPPPPPPAHMLQRLGAAPEPGSDEAGDAGEDLGSYEAVDDETETGAFGNTVYEVDPTWRLEEDRVPLRQIDESPGTSPATGGAAPLPSPELSAAAPRGRVIGRSCDEEEPVVAGAEAGDESDGAIFAKWDGMEMWDRRAAAAAEDMVPASSLGSGWSLSKGRRLKGAGADDDIVDIDDKASSKTPSREAADIDPDVPLKPALKDLGSEDDAEEAAADPIAAPAPAAAGGGRQRRRGRCRCPRGIPSASGACDACAARCYGCLRDFPCCMVHCPVGFACLVTLLAPAMLGVFWPGIEVNTSFDSFLEADGRSNEVRMIFLAAIKSNQGRRLGETVSASVPDGLDWNTLHRIRRVEFMYRAKSGVAATDAGLRELRDFELGLRNKPKWRHICTGIGNKVLADSCDPGLSLVNFAYPKLVNVDDLREKQRHEVEAMRFKFDGSGAGVPTAAAVAIGDEAPLRDLLFPIGTETAGGAKIVRSIYEFNMVCCVSSASLSDQRKKVRELNGVFDDFLASELYPEIKKFVARSRYYDVFYTGDGINTVELWSTLMGDSSMALGSAMFIFMYLTVHTRSLLLSLGTLLVSMPSIPMAFVMAAQLSGSNEITGASFLSLFLILGLGADVVLVFISFWEVSKVKFEKSDRPARMKYTLMNAGMSCLATTTTTAASFFANLASALRSLREFGFFMGLCISWAYLFILFIFPALLVLDERIRDRLKCTREEEAPLLPAVVVAGAQNGNVASTIFQRALGFYIWRFLVPLRWVLFIASLLIPALSVFWVMMAGKIESEMPAIFPPGHNQNDGKDVVKKFMPYGYYRPMVDGSFCVPKAARKAEDGTCFMSWCQVGYSNEAVGSWEQNGSATCQCYPDTLGGPDCFDYQPGERVKAFFYSRFVGPEYVAKKFWSGYHWSEHAKAALRSANAAAIDIRSAAMPVSDKGPRNLTGILQEHWESGTEQVSPFFRGQTMSAWVAGAASNPSLQTKICNAAEICYCGAPRCSFNGVEPGYEPSRTVELPAGEREPRTERRLDDEEAVGAEGVEGDDVVDLGEGRSASRRLAPSSSRAIAPLDDGLLREQRALGLRLVRRPPPSLEPRAMEFNTQFSPSSGSRSASGRRLAGTIDVSLVWGLEVAVLSTLLGKPKHDWSFDARFRPDTTQAQRHMLKACNAIKARQEFLVRYSDCWIQDFKDYLGYSDMAFPVRPNNFDRYFSAFASANTLSAERTWRGSDGKLAAGYLQFHVALSYEATPSGRILEYMDLWDELVTGLNRDGPPGAVGAFHTSRLWIRAEAEQAIVGSMVNTLALSAGCGFGGALAFTHCDVALSFLVVFSVIGVVAMLAFFMTVIMGWAFGAIEVLGLIIFVGYSITYALHIAHKYREHTLMTDGSTRCTSRDRRRAAVVSALQLMTNAVLGSAVTTLGSSFFLFFCTMQIFVKLALVLFTVTFLSGLFALLVLPAMLLCVGPLGCCGCGALCKCFACCDSKDAEDAADSESEADTGEQGELPISPSGMSERSTTEVFVGHSVRLLRKHSVGSGHSADFPVEPRSPTGTSRRLRACL
eukprot:TRINITY_DN21845_c0_g1_i1.p1 TRINITY_DN21845_c0_g1~~TRINITY_DN21845_c0_g1_i1.p1  ORF type:complete len:1626 (-),score=376.65 TRINITY_DN21845_c0_g1_i1:221-5098(-)